MHPTATAQTEVAAAATGRRTPPRRGRGGHHRRRQPSLRQTATVELAFQRANPLPLTELLGQCFMRQATAPGARRAVAVDTL